MPAARKEVPARAIALATPVMCAMATLAFLRVGLWVLFEARIGPVVATLTGSHGVHSGDVLGVGSVALAAAFAAATYISARDPRRVLTVVSAP
ncbi:MAG TPA: hypothetical protein VMZ73_08630 [Acidimicrobiales bacterium]|nr:hypothetical protein [Acidimicrobiales bacterium]